MDWLHNSHKNLLAQTVRKITLVKENATRSSGDSNGKFYNRGFPDSVYLFYNDLFIHF